MSTGSFQDSPQDFIQNCPQDSFQHGLRDSSKTFLKTLSKTPKLRLKHCPLFYGVAHKRMYIKVKDWSLDLLKCSYYPFGVNGDLRRLQFCYFNLLLGCWRWKEVCETCDKVLKVADITHFEWTEDIPGA